MSILRNSFFRDVHIAHDFDSRDQRIMNGLRNPCEFMQNAVCSKPDHRRHFKGFNMNIARACFISLADHVVDKLDNWRIIDALRQFGKLFVQR